MTLPPQPSARGHDGLAGYESVAASWPVTRDPGAAPKTVHIAIILVFVSMAFGLVDAVLAMNAALDGQDLPAGVDQSAVTTLRTVIIVLGALGLLVLYGVWAVFALMARQGRNWARITLTLLLGLNLLYAVISIPRIFDGSSARPVTAIPAMVVQLAVLAALWLEPASRWFPAKAAYRKAKRAGYPTRP